MLIICRGTDVVLDVFLLSDCSFSDWGAAAVSGAGDGVAVSAGRAVSCPIAPESSAWAGSMVIRLAIKVRAEAGRWKCMVSVLG
jgi:hypothetical protein